MDFVISSLENYLMQRIFYTKKHLFFSFFLLCGLIARAQFKPDNGVKESNPYRVLFTNATIYVSPNEKLDNANILIEGSRIVEVSTKAIKDNKAITYDFKGKTIVPAFIELNSNIGLPKPGENNFSIRTNSGNNNQGAFYWNDAVHPEFEAATNYQIDSKSNENLVKMGFGFALSHLQDGIVRGSGTLVSLGNQNSNKQILSTSPGQFYSFSKGSSNLNYPSSQMGSIALLRQALYDLKYYSSQQTKEERSISLEKWNSQLTLPAFFQSTEKWEILRAAKIANEFNLKFNYLGSGNEYAVAKDLKKLDASFIVPLNFPESYEVKDPYVSRQIPLSDLKHWELAPANAKLLRDQGITICFTTNGLKSSDQFWINLRKALKRGLKIEDALAALTTQPALILKASSEMGTLEKGKYASFSIYSSDPFLAEGKLLESWILGERNVISEVPSIDINGKYNFNLEENKYSVEITGSPEKPQGKVQTFKTLINKETNAKKVDTIYQKAAIIRTQTDITFQFNLADDLYSGSVSLHGKIGAVGGVFEGDGLLPNGKWIKWAGIRLEKDKSEKKTEAFQLDTTFSSLTWFPNMAFGLDSLPKKQVYVIKNVTLWTNEKDGVLKNANVVVENGKIFAVNPVNFPKNATLIDGTGKHLTTGIIDEHSHIAISKGVNESGQAITAEVSIGDVVNPDDINIYRQLAGGVTAAQLLHGSANPIGGQSGLIKLKWGHSPEQMLIPNAPKFIKCALGENVKQANWGDNNRFRFPQTRMGVEQVFYDGFLRAKAYKKEWEDYRDALKNKNPKKPVPIEPRRDLELDILLEILEKQRFITCHSYVQSEINMLMHVADSFGFNVNTFTHILEGYKLADKMKKHGAGGSTFSDWWAYKYEVNEAIPQNAKMMTDQGVVVAINSDDAEMGRRLNQEAAKSVKYGGMSEEEAWKLVTLNPAKLLHLDDRMGSVKAGKDADLVLWSDNPLSINAKVELTMVDGMILYNASENEKLAQRNVSERARIINKMLESNEKGESAQPFVKKGRKHFHCDTIGEEGVETENIH
jgi:imidazolonepropionase-like amidohydrolase